MEEYSQAIPCNAISFLGKNHGIHLCMDYYCEMRVTGINLFYLYRPTAVGKEHGLFGQFHAEMEIATGRGTVNNFRARNRFETCFCYYGLNMPFIVCCLFQMVMTWTLS